MKSLKHIAVFRFSAMGDVAMTIPVIRAFLTQNPDVKITFVSREKFHPLFEEFPNIHFYSADLNGKHKGISGLYKLAKALKKLEIDGIADLHNVLRTKVLCKFLTSNSRKIAVLNKGRKERKELIKSQNNVIKPIKPMSERYADVFRQLGFSLNLSHQLPKIISEKENAIGIAPFAMYEGKMYPLEKMKIVAQKIAEKDIKVYLFGGGKSEEIELKNWEKLNSNIESIAGKFDLKKELNIIQNLQLMVSMDSANMHLASLVGTKVISLWGNTHPYMGFLGYGQSIDDVIQDESLLQRPTSVFGKEKKNGEKIDYFKNISSEIVTEKILSSLSE